MRGIHPSPLTIPELGENLRVLTELTEEEAFGVRMVPGLGSLVGGAVNTYRATGYLGYVLFPNAVASAWAVTARAHPAWQGAGVRWSVWYTSNVGSTNTFNLFLGAAPFGDGMALTALADSSISAPSVAGPAVAETVLKHVYVNTGAVLHARYPWWSFRIARADPDNNANELWVLASLIEVLQL